MAFATARIDSLEHLLQVQEQHHPVAQVDLIHALAIAEAAAGQDAGADRCACW